MKKKLSLLIFITVDILIVLAVILITFRTTKDYYTVQFELNGGVLLSGELKQTIKFGQDAVPPVVSKDGEIFLEWSDDYTKVTEDKIIYALWDHESTFGLEFEVHWNGNYSLVSGAFDNITGDVYVSAYYQQRRVLGVKDGAFQNCNRITSVTLPDGMYSIGHNAFNGCSSLTSIELPDALVNIGDNAFAGCTNLTSLVIPNAVTSIGKNTFNGCSSLTTITLGSNIEEINGETFNNMMGLTEIKVALDNPYFTSIDGNLYSKDGKVLIKYATGKKEEVFNMPSSVEKIAAYAFDNVTNLKKINISNNLYEIENKGISNLENLEYTEFDNAYYLGNESNPYQILFKIKDQEISSVNVHQLTKVIYAEAFLNCTLLENVVIQEGLISIGDYAFKGCTNIKIMKLPTTVFTIGKAAFEDCNSLEEINIPNSVWELLDSTFNNCISLKNITLSKNLKTLSNYVFTNCYALENIELPKTLETIGNSVFAGCESLKVVNLSNNVSYIGSGIFQNCISLESVTIPFVGPELGSDNNTNFGYFFGTNSSSEHINYIPSTLKVVNITKEIEFKNLAFYNCKSLETIYLPNTLRKIDSNVFLGDEALVNVYYKGNADDWCKIDFVSVYSLPHYYAKDIHFLNDQNEYYIVNEIVLSDDVKELHSYQFYYLNSLKKIVLSNNISNIPSYAFAYNELLEYIYIGDNVETINSNAFYNSLSIVEFEVSSKNPYLTSHNTNIYSKDFKTLFFASNSKSNQKFVVLDGVETIAEYAFYGRNVKNILLPDSLKTIGDYAFNKCSFLENFTLPDGLESIGSFAFVECNNISTLIIPDTVTSIGDNAFKSCGGLTTVKLSENLNELADSLFYQCSKLNNIVIPNSVKKIGNSAFYGCTNLQEVVLSNQLESIGSSAFSSCISLANIYIPISVKTIGRYAFNRCRFIKIYCEVEQQPENWNMYWAPNTAQITWNVKINK